LEPIIEVRNLTKVFKSRSRKITAVDDVSFDVFNGEIFSMIGPNGAGKSTTFAMMTTLIKPTGGKIKVAGFDAENEDDRIRPIIGIVPQKLSLYPDLTARENLELMGNLYDVPKKLMEERIEYYLTLVNLENHADRFKGGFSGSMKQRLSVISAYPLFFLPFTSSHVRKDSPPQPVLMNTMLSRFSRHPEFPVLLSGSDTPGNKEFLSQALSMAAIHQSLHRLIDTL